jgi:hypothetical protein
MDLVSIEKIEPIEGEWYIVFCPKWSEARWDIAKWFNGKWWQEATQNSISPYIKSYNPKTLDEM